MREPGPVLIDADARSAGGYDAAWVLVLDPSDGASPSPAIASIERLWATWTEMAVKPLSDSSRVYGRVASTGASDDGLRNDVLGQVPGLEAALSARPR